MATKSNDSSLKIYFDDIKQYNPLSKEDEIELFNRYSEGDECARDTAKETIINSNLRYVVSRANMYCLANVDVMDLISEGNRGLVEAVDRFDVSSGNRFTTFATWWIDRYILKYLDENCRAIRIPGNILPEYRKINNFKVDYVSKFECQPSVIEIADGTGLSEKRIKELEKITYSFNSLDTEIGDNEKITFGDMIEDKTLESPLNGLVESEELSVLRNKLALLPENERKVISLRYGLNGNGSDTINGVVKKLNITRTNAIKLENSALNNLRNMMAA